MLQEMDNSKCLNSVTTTASSLTIGSQPVCEYYLPCGWCKLKKEKCDYYISSNIGVIDPYPYPFVSVYAAHGLPKDYFTDVANPITTKTITQ